LRNVVLYKEKNVIEIPALTALLAAVKEVELREKRRMEVTEVKDEAVTLPCLGGITQKFALPNIFEGVN
jgi:hypothetical protein